MSGFYGAVARRAAPISLREIGAVENQLKFRGPDGSRSLVRSPAAMAFAWFRGADVRTSPMQPAELDHFTLVGDLRLDARPRGVDQTLGDAASVLHAFRADGASALDALRGDYAFGIWNAITQTWFCARDGLGVKPLYYIDEPQCFAFSNTPHVLLTHTSRELNDDAITRFLMYGINDDLSATALSALKMLPPGHSVRASTQNTEGPSRYWSLRPTASSPMHADDCVAQFLELAEQAVKARLPAAGRTTIALSGGVDSALVAALAQSRAPGLRALTIDDSPIRDDTPEFDYAAAVASALNIEHVGLPVATWEPPAAASVRPDQVPVEPLMALPGSQQNNLMLGSLELGEVLLTGHGGDPIMTPERGYLLQGLMSAPLRLLRDWQLHKQIHGQAPPLYLRTALRQASRRPPRPPPIPPWLTRRLHAPAEALYAKDESHRHDESRAYARHEAARVVTSPFWARVFQHADAGLNRGTPTTMRNPLFDEAVVQFCVGLASMPWCHDKWLLRHALPPSIPPTIRTRPKTPVPIEPEHRFLLPHYEKWGTELLQQPRISEFLDAPVLLRMLRNANRLRPQEYTLLARPLYLAFWLRQLDRAYA